jgi:glutaredoxin
MVTIKILTSPGCAGCGKAKEVVGRVSKEFPKLKVEIVDVVENHAEAQKLISKYSAMSAPTVIIENGKGEVISLGGAPKEEKLREKIKERFSK